MKKITHTELIEDLDLGLSRVELVGNRRVSIENHKGIQEYSGESMRIALSDGQLHIIGQEMELHTLTLTELSVEGQIISLEYLKEQAHGRKKT